MRTEQELESRRVRSACYSSNSPKSAASGTRRAMKNPTIRTLRRGAEIRARVVSTSSKRPITCGYRATLDQCRSWPGFARASGGSPGRAPRPCSFAGKTSSRTSSWALVRMPRSIRTSWSIERVVFGFRRRDRHQRRAVEPLFVECGAERGGGLVDGLFLVAPTALTLANDPVIAFMVTL